MITAIAGPARLPLRWGSNIAFFTLLHFTVRRDRPDQPGAARWVAAYTGDLGDGPTPLRIESACLFGHVLGSQQCDCGFQLDAAMRQFAARGRGLLIYGVDDDARGLGTAAHFSIYQLRQQENLDTAEVFERLGAPWDSRDYSPVVAILKHLGIGSVVLLSNNDARLRFLLDHGIAAELEPLEAPLTVHNMSTLMLEKEDLGYRWSFETHADWLEPMQQEVAGDLDASIACLVVPGRGIADAGERTVRGDPWTLVDQLARHQGPPSGPGPLVCYLTDLPRLDDVARYADLGAQVIVVPFTPLPDALVEAGRAAGVRIVDWARRNAYPVERPQWRRTLEADGIDVYIRQERCRLVVVDPDRAAPVSELRRRAAAAGVAEPAGPRHERWLELPRDSLAAVLKQRVQTASGHR